MNLNTENRGERLYKAFVYVVLGILAILILIARVHETKGIDLNTVTGEEWD